MALRETASYMLWRSNSARVAQSVTIGVVPPVVRISGTVIVRRVRGKMDKFVVFLSRSAQRIWIFQDIVEREVSGSASSRQKLKPIFAHAGRKTWLDHHFRDTIASSCFYTWGITAGKQASGGCDQSSNFAQFCSEMHVFNRGFSYATHFWYNPVCFKTAAKERIGYICSDWAHW